MIHEQKRSVSIESTIILLPFMYILPKTFEPSTIMNTREKVLGLPSAMQTSMQVIYIIIVFNNEKNWIRYEEFI